MLILAALATKGHIAGMLRTGAASAQSVAAMLRTDAVVLVEAGIVTYAASEMIGSALRRKQ